MKSIRHARAIYRDLWEQHRESYDAVEMANLGKRMDELQMQIATDPSDARWLDFIKTLPGYREYWEAKDAIAKRNFRLRLR